MGNSTLVVHGRRSTRARIVALAALTALVASLLVTLPPAARAEAASPCGPDVNAIECENRNPGTSPDVWDIEGAGDASIQGFATDISVNVGPRIDFKIEIGRAH